jgi:hypothetical protein
VFTIEVLAVITVPSSSLRDGRELKIIKTFLAISRSFTQAMVPGGKAIMTTVDDWISSNSLNNRQSLFLVAMSYAYVNKDMNCETPGRRYLVALHARTFSNKGM